jgi:hypothetical protein
MANIKTNTDRTEAVILDANGIPTSMPTQMITAEEAALLRLYKKFLHAHGLREAVHCNECYQGAQHDGMEAWVTDSEIMWKCRHRVLYYKGQSY